MKKRFDLQLFAEEAATDAAAAPAAEQAEEPAKPEPAPAAVLKEKGAKYTDADVDEILNRKFAEWQKKQQKATKNKSAQKNLILSSKNVQPRIIQISRHTNFAPIAQITRHKTIRF